MKISAISNWISLIVQIFVGFFLTPYIISHLGQSGYGVWVLVGSFIGYYGLLNLGVGSAITRYIARFSAQKDIKGLNETANTALIMFSTTGIIAVILSFVLASPLSNFFKVAPEHAEEFKRLVVVLGISTGLSFPSGVFSAMITARERFVALNIINIFSTLIRAGLTIAILKAGYGLASIAYPTLASTIISIIAFFLLARSVMPEFHFRFDNVHLSTLKTLLVYGGYTTIIAVADILRLKIDSLVIGKMIGMAEVGIYGISAILLQYMLNIIVSGMGVLSPRFAALDVNKNNTELQSTFLKALSISSFIACSMTLLIIIFGETFVFLWVGDDYMATVPVLIILAVSYAFALSQTPGISLMYALNKHSYYAAATILETLTNIVLSILLARHYGIIGVAMGTAIPMLFVKLFVQPIYVARLAGVHISRYAASVAPAIVVAFIVFLSHSLLIFFADFNIAATSSYITLLLYGVIIETVYITIICTISPPVLETTQSILVESGIAIKKFLTIRGDV